MNSLMESKWMWVDGMSTMRTALLDAVTDTELAYTPGGTAMPLGALVVEMGETQANYIESFKTLSDTWEFENPDPARANSVAALKAWFAELDAELKATLEAFSEDDLAQTITRGGYPMPIPMQLDVYIQAALIFFGKYTIYLRAMNKPLGESVQQWIG